MPIYGFSVTTSITVLSKIVQLEFPLSHFSLVQLRGARGQMVYGKRKRAEASSAPTRKPACFARSQAVIRTSEAMSISPVGAELASALSPLSSPKRPPHNRCLKLRSQSGRHKDERSNVQFLV